jgi:hypothetical protein
LLGEARTAPFSPTDVLKGGWLLGGGEGGGWLLGEESKHRTLQPYAGESCVSELCFCNPLLGLGE